MNCKPWADWELQFLRDEYGGSLTRDIARALNRGIDAVRVRVRKLGLQCRADWTPELDEVLALMYPDTSAVEISALIGRTPGAVRERAARLRLKKDPAFGAEHARRTTLARSAFTQEIAAQIEQLYPNTDTEEVSRLTGIDVARIHAYANHNGWRKTKEFLSEQGRQRMTPDHPGWKAGFQKGHVPANKGRKGYDPGGRSSETRFKKGNRPHTWKPIGSYRINADGYLDRKISDTGYPPRDWRPVHRLVWIEANGPLPAGHVVRFKPGRRTVDPEQITADALECITQAENARRNVWHAHMPPELRKLMGARIALARAINRRQRENEDRP